MPGAPSWPNLEKFFIIQPGSIRVTFNLASFCMIKHTWSCQIESNLSQLNCYLLRRKQDCLINYLFGEKKETIFLCVCFSFS